MAHNLPDIDARTLLTLTSRAITNVNRFVKDADILFQNSSTHHSLYLCTIGVEEWIHAVLYHAEAYDLRTGSKGRRTLLSSKRSALSLVSEALDYAIEVAFVSWIKQSESAFELIIQLLQSDPEEGKATLQKLIAILTTDRTREEALMVKSLVELKQSDYLRLKALSDAQKNSCFVTINSGFDEITDEVAEDYLSVLFTLNDFTQMLAGEVKKQLGSEELFEKNRRLQTMFGEFWKEKKLTILENLY